MSRVVYDLAAKRQSLPSAEPLSHPSGVDLPFDGPADAVLIIPEVRSAIRSGNFSSEIIELLPQALKADDRVLVIGAGLGVVSTLVAKSGLANRIIAVEANTALIPYLNRVHDLNGVSEIETVNGVLAEGKKGRVPFFSRRDIRTSSLLPHDRAWQQVMMVPFMDLGLILKEERITLVICEIPLNSARILAQGALDTVERVLVALGDQSGAGWEEDGLCTGIVQRGYATSAGHAAGPDSDARAALFERAEAH
jgi:hypothetical protein